MVFCFLSWAHMTKTNMAEAVRERPRETKPKPKKSRAKKPQSEEKEPALAAEVPVPSTTLQLNVQHGDVSADVGSAQDIPATSDQSYIVNCASRSEGQGNLTTQDLEMDGAAVVDDEPVPFPDVTNLASCLEDTLQFDSHVNSDGDPACSGDMMAAATGDPDLNLAVEGESVVPTADLIHMEENVSQEQPVSTEDLLQLEESERHQHELSPVSAYSTETRLQAGDADAHDKPPSPVSSVPQPASELTTAPDHIQETPEQSGFEVTVVASAPVSSHEVMECGSGPELLQTATASAPMPSLEPSVPSLRQQTAEASAPKLSLEPCAPEPVQEMAASPLPAMPATVEVLPLPSAPPVKPMEKPSVQVTMGLTERRIAESLYPQVPMLESPTTSTFQPMTDKELQQLYYNPELQAMDAFVEDFVQNEEKKTSHEYYEIVMNYYRSRKSLLSVEEDLRLLRKNYDQILAEMWIKHIETKTVDGQCEDKCRVSQVHTSEQCELNKEALANLKTNLLSVRNEMQGDLALFAYSSQMSRLQVESYNHLLFSRNSLLRDMPKDAPVTAVDRTRDDLLPQIKKLKDCISVLFTFHRKPTKDIEFIQNIRKWTSRMVAALLRVASYGDHLFVLNHVMRAPAGIRKWARGYIQVPAPASLQLQTTLGGAVLDHAVTCLAVILLPVRERETFMCQMKTNVTEASVQMAETWTMVDSDGEEDEDPSQAWLYLHENDLVEVLLQLPLQAIFTHILQAPVDDNGTIHYDVSRSTEPSLMKLFAFCTTWISLLGKGLHTYSMARYKNLNKRLGSLIRQTVAFVSDHLLNYKEYYRDLASASSLQHLQLEFDQLFMRATYAILTAQKLGSWQFMAEMPFTSLSSDSIWCLLWLLQQVHGQPVDLKTLPPVDRCKEDMKDIESRRQLADTLQMLPASESIYLLTTFANMAIARPLEEDEFIECITLQVFEIAFICNHTRDFCSKTGRSLLASIIQKHPTAMSMLLRRVQGVMAELGMMSLCLFDELPASIWIPQDPDMLLLRQWLLTNDLDTPENQLARCVIKIMNWDLFTETGKLVLDIRLHRQMALLLVESYNKYISDRRASYLIIEGMKQMTYPGEVSREQKFNNWVWSIALRLKLHREAAILLSRAAESRPFHPPCLEEEQWLLPLSSAAKAKSPLACFLVLSMTDVGHNTSRFISVGLDMLLTLAQGSQFSCVIHVLSCVTPLFITTPQYLLENDTFQKILQILLSADESVLKMTKMALGSEFKAGTVTQQLTQMIQASISARLEHGEGLPTLMFWVQAIFKVSHFLTDMNCCYVLDHLVRWGYLQKGARDKLEEVFRQYHKQLQSESKPRAGFLTWVAGGSGSPPSLMERASMGEFGWLALQVLSLEDDLDQESGVWPALQQTLLANQSLSLDTALKQVVSRLKPEYPRTVGRLCLYRWAQQAVDMPIAHPIMPLVWQRFFSLFLGRCAQQDQLPRRASVGERFLQSGSSLMKRLRKKLGEAADFHSNYNPKDSVKKKRDNTSPAPHTPSHFETGSPLPSPQTEESPQYSSSKEFHNQLAELYQMFSLWLEEPRLHGADLYLPSLPAQYNSHRLMQMFTPSKNLWLEFVDFEGEQYDITVFAAEWRKIVTGHPQTGQRWATSQPAQRTPKQRIMRRLQRFEDPKPAPALQPVEAPVPDIPSSILADKAAAIHLMDSDLSVLTNFTKFFSTRAAQQCAVDAAFLDLVPGQYRNVTKVITLQIECRSRVNPYHKCSGAAKPSLRVKEMEVNPIVQRKMDENRAEYKQLVIESELPPPQNVCIAAVHVENAITLLIKLSQATTDPDRRRALCDVACTLFFHLTVQVCEETNFYPPTRQFFASCVEILGQEFVSREPSQTVLLLQFCLDNPGLAGLVAPHFVPNNAPQHLLAMYEQLITTLQQQNLNLVFMLLTKFDVLAWLENIRPPADDRTRFVEILGNALMTCGAEPSDTSKMVFDLYLSHLRVVLKHQFPDNLYKVLHLLLQGSSNEALHTRCWEMFLMECCAPLSGVEPTAASAPKSFSVSQVQACSTIPLSTLQLDRMLKWLGGFFRQERVSHGDLMKFGLYPRWRRYVPYVALLMGFLARSFVAKVLAAIDPNNPFDAIQQVWVLQLEMWQAWMEPLTIGVPPAGRHGAPPPMTPACPEVVAPWTDGDSSVAVSMVEAFRSTLMFTHDTLAAVTPQYSSSVFSLLLIHYVRELCGPHTPPHVTDVLMAEFSKLPWEQLRPDFQVMDMMIFVKQTHSPSCFRLIAHILTRVRWPEVIGQFRAHHDPQVPSLLLEKLLLLLVQCCGDPFVRELPEVCQLLTSAETYEWRGLTKEAYHRATNYFLQVCQPAWILAQRSSAQALGFRLLKRTADFSPEAGEAWTRDMSEKRLMFVRCMSQQLCQVTYQDSTDPDVVYTVLLNLLSEVEAVEAAVLDPRCREEESMDMMKELLSLLNNSQPCGVWHGGLLKVLCQWLQSSPHSVLLTPTIKAASRYIASVAQLVQVVETCIHVYFASHNEATGSSSRKASLTSSHPPAAVAPLAGAMNVSGWDHILSVMQVPELSMEQYTQEALSNGSFLTLYALLLHRRSLCQQPSDQAVLLEEVLDWTKKAAPTADNEAKLLLWWLEFCRMWLYQLDTGSAVPQCVVTMHSFLDLLQPLAEDRATTGILSIIGLGRRSPLSPQFRLAVRSLSAFLSSQVLDDNTLRFQPTSPLSEQPRAKQCRAALSALRTNRTYTSLKDTVESMIGFVHRTDHTARSVLDLILELCFALYPQCLYLKTTGH